MSEEDLKILEKLNQVRKTAESYLQEKNFGNYDVKDVIRYRKQVELTEKNTEDKKTKKFYLYVVKLENINPEIKEKNPLTELEYLVEEDENGEIIKINTISDLIKDYDKKSFENIRDVVDKTKENEEKPEKEQEEDLKKDSLEELELEKEEKENKKDKDKKTKEEDENIQRKPKHIIQTIDTDAYADNVETIHRAFRLPPNVKKLAFAYPNKEDKSELGSGATIYMLDEHDNIVGDAKEYFRVDDATGKNPMHDDSTELELDETGERHTGKTKIRFQSTQRPDQHLSLKTPEVGQYPEVCADREKETQNAYIGNQVETRNVEIQTSLEMQTINSTYKGVFLPDDIDKEVDKHEEHGDDIDNTSKKNLDGREDTKEPCEKNIYLLYQCVAELKEQDEYIRENFSDENIIKTLIFNIDRNPSISKDELMQETSEMFHNSKIYQETKDAYPSNHKEESNEHNEFYKDGLWSSAKH